MVYGVGVNDMERGWTEANEWNHKVYKLWCNMIQRCYDKKYHERRPTYKNCHCCERWLTLSNFVEDIKLIDGYDYWLNHPNERVALDKDIKSNGINKCYCLENCCFTTNKENCRQANKTRDNEQFRGKNNSCAILVDRFDKQGNYIDTKYQFEYVAMGMGFTASGISLCCTGRYKSTGGYVFKYHKE